MKVILYAFISLQLEKHMNFHTLSYIDIIKRAKFPLRNLLEQYAYTKYYSLMLVMRNSKYNWKLFGSKM